MNLPEFGQKIDNTISPDYHFKKVRVEIEKMSNHAHAKWRLVRKKMRDKNINQLIETSD